MKKLFLTLALMSCGKQDEKIDVGCEACKPVCQPVSKQVVSCKDQNGKETLYMDININVNNRVDVNVNQGNTKSCYPNQN